MRPLFHALFAPAAALALTLSPALAAGTIPDVTFPSIDGGGDQHERLARPSGAIGEHGLALWIFRSVENHGALHEELGPKGLIVVAVPSNDFNQELDDAKKVKEYCTLEFGITLPMTDIVSVAKGDVHPLYQWLKTNENFVPKWNFYKVLIDAKGEVIDTYSSMTAPDSRSLRKEIDQALLQK